MKNKSGQKTAVIVGMLIGLPDLLLIHFEADEASCQAPALAEWRQQPASQRLASR